MIIIRRDLLKCRRLRDLQNFVIGCRHFLRRRKRTHDHLHSLRRQQGTDHDRRLLPSLQVPIRFRISFRRNFLGAAVAALRLPVFRGVRIRRWIPRGQKRVRVFSSERLLLWRRSAVRFLRSVTFIRRWRFNWRRRSLGKRHYFFVGVTFWGI